MKKKSDPDPDPLQNVTDHQHWQHLCFTCLHSLSSLLFATWSCTCSNSSRSPAWNSVIPAKRDGGDGPLLHVADGTLCLGAEEKSLRPIHTYFRNIFLYSFRTPQTRHCYYIFYYLSSLSFYLLGNVWNKFYEKIFMEVMVNNIR